MIKNNFQLGKHNIQLCAEFGSGDIEIINHHSEEDKVVYTSFSNGVNYEIGVHVDFANGETSDDLKEIPFIMKFNKVESIDVLIKQLEQSKSKLIELKESENS